VGLWTAIFQQIFTTQSLAMKQFLYCCLLLSAFTRCAAQQSPFSASLDSLIQFYENEKQFSGVVMVSQKGKVLYGKAFGYADKEKQVLNEVTTNFNIASVGKTFTAVLIMQLIQEGKLSLDETVANLLPQYKIKNAEAITVRQLLTHTSGINNYMQHPSFEKKMKNLKSLDDVMHLVSDMPATMQHPGDKFDYSNSGFITLGRIIEKITGKDYTTNLHERVFKKTGITNSYIHHPATFNAPAEAVPYYVFSKRAYKNAVAEEFPAFSDGGMQSNVIDLTNFANGLLQGKLLNADVRKQLWTGVASMGRGGKYGFGWIDNENPYGKHIISHDGGGKGFSTDLKIVEEDEYVIVVQINNRLNPREISNNILKLIYTGKFDAPKKAFENLVFEEIENTGWNKTKESIPQLLSQNGLNKFPGVWAYVRLMEMLAETGRTAIAYQVLEMANADFPTEAGPYNVAAQIAVDKGDKEGAKRFYEKALVINPSDDFAKNGLSALK
jgi:CubicO group peptidase (beta-lactamase class C family)